MKCLLSAPRLLVAVTSATLFAGICNVTAHAEEPLMPQAESAPARQPLVTNSKPAPPLTLQKPAQNWENTLTILRNDPALTTQLSNDPQLTQAISAAVARENAAGQKRLQDAQAAVQMSRSQLDAATRKLNAARALSAVERAPLSEQVSKLRQQLAQNLSRLQKQPSALIELQTKLKQLQATGLSWSTTLIAPKMPTLALPQGRNLLYTPADAATIIKRNLLLTPEDRAAVKAIPLHK